MNLIILFVLLDIDVTLGGISAAGAAGILVPSVFIYLCGLLWRLLQDG